tara:strand:+ start:486 stop:758 length:273 start_codon:yes stop_codon:yes gene_type:complete
VGPPKLKMSYFVYLISSVKKSKLTTYVGYTNNLKKRLSLHNNGKGAKFTRGRRWKVIYSEKYATKNEALSREYYIKKNRKFRNLIKEYYK